MRIIPTRVHGILDYLVGLILIVSPWVLGFSHVEHHAAVWLPVVLGVGALLYSLMTAYELGLLALIPMPAHLGLDIGSGVLLVASPWLFGFSHEVYWPHLIFGLLEIGAGLMTQTTPRHVNAPAVAA